ncbi:MAG TPA: hypothetical protein PK970_14270, partial [Hyphomicrobiaceae bacterium]|nr:hypothetical protein [Hyphomicrobiaceae bacterium]
MKWFRWLAILGVVFAIAPMLSMLLAGTIASHYGCTLNEGNPHPCVIAGADRGHTLYNMAMMGWLTIFTLPYGVGAVLLWLVAEVVAFVRRRR